MFKFNSCFKALLFLSFLFTIPLLAQTEMAYQGDPNGPKFHFDATDAANINDFSESKLNTYFEIMYDELQFVKSDDGFDANYEISIVIFDKDGDQADGNIWKENIHVDKFDMTNSRTHYFLSNATFMLEPGDYKISVAVQDLESGLSTTQKGSIKVTDYSKDKINLSDIILVNQVMYDSVGIKSIRPEVSDIRKGVSKSVSAYYEIYNPLKEDAANVEYEIRGQNTKTRIKKSFNVDLDGIFTPGIIEIPADSLPHDIYNLAIKIKTKKNKVDKKKKFYIRYSGLPTTTADLQSAIEQVKYIATREEWKRLKKSKGDKKLEEFKEFWLRHDPTPGTEVNEAMDAHYARVEYANNNFNAMQRDGWKTDMGMIYIMLGAPDDVIREPFPSYSNSWEVWSYYRYNRKFQFYDHTGFGEFRLATPFSIYEIQRYLRR